MANDSQQNCSDKKEQAPGCLSFSVAKIIEAGKTKDYSLHLSGNINGTDFRYDTSVNKIVELVVGLIK
jgi:hypothetical protein